MAEVKQWGGHYATNDAVPAAAAWAAADWVAMVAAVGGDIGRMAAAEEMVASRVSEALWGVKSCTKAALMAEAGVVVVKVDIGAVVVGVVALETRSVEAEECVGAAHVYGAAAWCTGVVVVVVVVAVGFA